MVFLDSASFRWYHSQFFYQYLIFQLFFMFLQELVIKNTRPKIPRNPTNKLISIF